MLGPDADIVLVVLKSDILYSVLRVLLTLMI